jgi:nuclear RNA export factor
VPGGGGGGAADALAARIEGGAVGRSVNGMTNTQQTTGKTIATLKQFLTSRFAIDSQFLNLEAMATDAILLREDVKPPGIAGAHKDIGSVMWKLCKEMFPNVSQ